jgi:hypothetical protein
LSSVRVYAVGSTDCDWEYISAGAFATSCNHGGAQLRVAVLEFGYGSVYPAARMSGNALPSSAKYQSQAVCGTTTNFTFSCSAGQTVIGTLNYYDLDGYQSGNFQYQNTSINGGGTFSTQINIL